MTTGEKIKQARIAKDMTQEDLAERLGYKSKASVSHLERGRDIPRSLIVRLADILDIAPAYLMGWEEERSISMENIPLRGCDGAKIEQVIVTRALKGSGTEDDPYREVTQYWTLDGKFLFEKVT